MHENCIFRTKSYTVMLGACMIPSATCIYPYTYATILVCVCCSRIMRVYGMCSDDKRHIDSHNDLKPSERITERERKRKAHTNYPITSTHHTLASPRKCLAVKWIVSNNRFNVITSAVKINWQASVFRGYWVWFYWLSGDWNECFSLSNDK